MSIQHQGTVGGDGGEKFLCFGDGGAGGNGDTCKNDGDTEPHFQGVTMEAMLSIVVGGMLVKVKVVVAFVRRINR
jgi:hypothetical protein